MTCENSENRRERGVLYIVRLATEIPGTKSFLPTATTIIWETIESRLGA